MFVATEFMWEKKPKKKSLRSGTERNEARSEFCRSDNNEKDGYERYVRV